VAEIWEYSADTQLLTTVLNSSKAVWKTITLIYYLCNKLITMAKIGTYAAATPTLTDLLLGTDVGSADATKNFTVQTILALASSAVITLPAYATDAAAGVGGLATGQLWQTTAGHSLGVAGIVMVKQ
jgi:hypothetical protein